MNSSLNKILLLVAAAILTVSCEKQVESKVVASLPPPPQADVWRAVSYEPSEREFDYKAILDPTLNALDTTLAALSAKGLPEVFQKKIDAYIKTSTEYIHRDLLKLKGRRIDVFGMEHLSSTDTSDPASAIKSQLEIGNMLTEEKYEVMFTEDFSSDTSLLTKERILKDFAREAIDAGFPMATPEQAEIVVLNPMLNDGGSAALNMWQKNPNIQVVGVDYYPIKRIQQHFMGEGANPQRVYPLTQDESDGIMLSMSYARDLHLLRAIANSSEYSNKKCAIVFGARHAPHLVKLLVMYGVKTTLRLHDSTIQSPYVVDAFATEGVRLQ